MQPRIDRMQKLFPELNVVMSTPTPFRVQAAVPQEAAEAAAKSGAHKLSIILNEDGTVTFSRDPSIH